MSKKYRSQTKKQSEEIIKILIDTYKDAKCGLDYSSPFYLVVALILAAQCTDKRVNEITPLFFKRFPTIEDVKNASMEDVIEIIKPCGFYKNKASQIIELSKIIVEKYNSKTPSTIEELTKFKGVGRKTANLVLTKGFGISGICVDIHVHRISNRLGYVNTKTPDETELELRKILPKKYWIDFNTYLVTLGQNICKPQKPNCSNCSISKYCKKVFN